MPNGEDCAGERCGRGEVRMRQDRSHAGILHAHFDSDGPAIHTILPEETGDPIAQRESENIMEDHREKDPHRHGFKIRAVQRHDAGDNRHDGKHGNRGRERGRFFRPFGEEPFDD